MRLSLFPGLKIIKSTTIRGSCEISAFMEWNTDIDNYRRLIEIKIIKIKNNLPPGTDILCS